MTVMLRRTLFLGGVGLGGLALFTRRALSRSASEEEDVSPGEDLMREHGVLERALLIYTDAAGRLERGADLPADVVPGTARLLREFIEQYHEKLEEEFLFPRFRRAGRHVELVDVLQQQHDAGRRVTDEILERSKTGTPTTDDARRALAGELRAYVRMYVPHQAREDTVLFPAFRKLVSSGEYESLGAQFEEREHQLFGEGGFAAKVEQVAALERKLGIYELKQFTPSA